MDDSGARRKLPMKVADLYRAHAKRLVELVRKVTGPHGNQEEFHPELIKEWATPVRIAIKLASTAATKIANLRQMDAAFTIAQPHLSGPADAWDRDAHLLAVPNGVINLR
jgi:hypothetical protein